MSEQNPVEEQLRTIWEALNQDEDERQQQAFERLLWQRAQQYATRTQEPETHRTDAEAVLIFTLYGDRYAIPVEVVRSVRPLGDLTRVPGVPHFYRGVVNVRGRVVSVLDLHAFLRIPVRDAAAPGELVLAEASGLFLGLLAERVEMIHTLEPQAIQPVLDLPYTRGMIEGHTALLDLAALFTDTTLIVGSRSEV